MNWKQYKRKGLSEMRPYIQGEVLPPCVSISEADLKNGSPKVGDMIARNPKNHDDQWLVAEKYFNDNLEPAPAPEETQNGVTMQEWYGGFSKIESTEPASEWRELGPDEVIGADDEYKPASVGDWILVPLGWIGSMCYCFNQIRTRRPLPKQEEMPLEEHLDYLTREASRAADIHNHVLIVDCLRYLRDEIQKIKEIK